MNPWPSRSAETATTALADAADASLHTAAADRARLIQEGTPLAYALAAGYARDGREHDELRQVAALALIGAVDAFEPERGSSFGAYATPTIRGALRRYFRDSTWLVRPPRGLQELRLRVVTAGDDLTQRLGRQPSRADVAAHLRIPVDDVARAELAQRNRTPASLDQPLTGRRARSRGADGPGGGTLADLLPDPGSELDDVEWRVALHQCLDRLPPRERELVRLRFVEGLSQQRIAQRMKISQMQVSRNLAAVLARLRGLLEAGADALGEPHGAAAEPLAG